MKKASSHEEKKLLININGSSPKLNPDEFEQQVRAMLDAMGHQVLEYRSEHKTLIQGVDGEYEIDVSARFSAFGMDFLMLVECKQYKNPIKREKLQILHDKMRSVGAQKAALFTTSRFQSGALEYAKKHNIATVEIVDGKSIYKTRSFLYIPRQPPEGIPPVAGWLVNGSNLSLVSADYGEALGRFLFGSQSDPTR